MSFTETKGLLRTSCDAIGSISIRVESIEVWRSQGERRRHKWRERWSFNHTLNEEDYFYFLKKWPFFCVKTLDDMSLFWILFG